MDKGLRKKMQRIQQTFSQTVGRAERTEVLADVQHVEQRIERVIQAVGHTKARLADCLRSSSKTEVDNVEKRRRKVEEHHLAVNLLHDSRELEASPETGLLSQVLGCYGSGMSAIVDEIVKTDMDLEKEVVDGLAKYVEDEKRITGLKDKLKSIVLDMDSAKRRLNVALTQGADEKIDPLQDEVDSQSLKVDSAKDNFITELYVLAAKEVEIANLFSVLVEIQMEYHRTALRTLEGVLPEIQRKIATYPRRPVFGCPLEDHLRYSGRKVAVVLEVCCAALCQIGLSHEGLFRISGNHTKVRRLKAGFDAGEIDLADYDKDPHSLAGTLKSYLRELPDPLMTHALYNEWVIAGKLEDDARKRKLHELLGKLPPANYDNLRYLIRFLRKVSQDPETKMPVSNLAIVIGPNLVGSPQGDNMLGTRLCECLLQHVDYFFPAGDIFFTSDLIGSLDNRTAGFGRLKNGQPLTTVIQNEAVIGPMTDISRSDNAQNIVPRHSPTPPHTQSFQSGTPTSYSVSGGSGSLPKQARPKSQAPPPPKHHHAPPRPMPLPPTLSAPGFMDEQPLPSSEIVSEQDFLRSSSRQSASQDSLNDYGHEYASILPASMQHSVEYETPMGDPMSNSYHSRTSSSSTATSFGKPTTGGFTTPPTVRSQHRKTNSYGGNQQLPPPPSTTIETVLPLTREQPNRPPPPHMALDRNSGLRGSSGSERRPKSYVHAVQDHQQYAPIAKPRRHADKSTPTASGGTVVTVNPPDPAPTNAAATSPDRPKPPLPMKPRLMTSSQSLSPGADGEVQSPPSSSTSSSAPPIAAGLRTVTKL